MSVLTRHKKIALDALGDKLRLWFVRRDYTIRTHTGPTSYSIMAKKSGTVRVVFAACRALIVTASHSNGDTIIEIKQGSWSENLWSNAGWFLATGGANLAFTLWSYEVEREFKNYAKGVLDSM